jgi:hypothetical protein
MTKKKNLTEAFHEFTEEADAGHLYQTLESCQEDLIELYVGFLQEHCGYAGADGLEKLKQDAFELAVNEISDCKPKELAEYESEFQQIHRLIQSKLYED